MNAAVERLIPELAALPAPDRAEIARYLIASLEPQGLEQEDLGAESAWDQELSRRVAEIRSGIAAGKPASRVFGELRDRLS